MKQELTPPAPSLEKKRGGESEYMQSIFAIIKFACSRKGPLLFGKRRGLGDEFKKHVKK